MSLIRNKIILKIFKNYLDTIAPKFTDQRQHDLQEFLSVVLNNLNIELKNLDLNIIEDIFEGKFQKIFRCVKCDITVLAKKQDQFFIVNIPTVSNNYDKELETCLEEFVGESTIQWHCLKCATNEEDVASLFSIQFTKLPKILVIRLKTSVQHNASISYSHKIKLEKYYKPLDSEKESFEYNLIGVICPFGTVSGEHC